MKTLFFHCVIIVVTIMLAIFVPSLANASTSSEEFETYTNEDYGFGIGYPKDWEVREYNLQENEVVNFMTTDDSPGVFQIAILDITTSPLQNATLKELVDHGIELGRDKAKQISRVNTTIAGLPAEEKIYYQYDLGMTVKSLEAITLTPNKELISIHYVTEPQFFDDNLETVHQMIQSYKIGVS